MKYSEVGFRAMYRNFCAVPLKENLKLVAKDFPGIDSANYLLGYGYIDHEAGMTLEILAAGKKGRGGVKFFETSKTATAKIRAGAIEDDEFYIIDDEDGRLKERYASKMESLSAYDVSEEVEETRGMRFLDECRHPHYPDDVQVYLMKDELELEVCWARIIGLAEHWFMAVLLNEPHQNFGYHEGDRIAFFVKEMDDSKIICYSNMNPDIKITAEDLADGNMLKSAVSAFNSNRCEQTFIGLLEILRDSFVWVPCNAVLGEEDRNFIEKLIEESDDDLESVIGQTFSNQNEIRMIPDILQNGDDYFFPIFSSAEEMGEYGDHFSKVQKHVLETIILARNNDKKVAGIVLNAFSEPFVLDAELFDIVEKMNSRIEV